MKSKPGLGESSLAVSFYLAICEWISSLIEPSGKEATSRFQGYGITLLVDWVAQRNLRAVGSRLQLRLHPGRNY
jgi:hypothetical protein